MPMKKERYPDNWKLIADLIKDRDEWTCQECGLKHGQVIVRNVHNPALWREATADDPYYHRSRIVMTVHHIGIEKPDGTPGDPDDKMDCRRDNLITLCPRCHLLADQDGHLKHAAETRIANKRQAQVDAGQGELF